MIGIFIVVIIILITLVYLGVSSVGIILIGLVIAIIGRVITIRGLQHVSGTPMKIYFEDRRFAPRVNEVLSDNGWGIPAVETFDKSSADIIIDSIKTRKAESDGVFYSYTDYGVRPIVIYFDEVNFFQGVPRSGLNVYDYQKYVILHEYGHALGYDHGKCEPGQKCPIMYQMTKGVPIGSYPTSDVVKKDLSGKRIPLFI